MKEKILQFIKNNISIVFFLIAVFCFWLSNYIHFLVFPGLCLILIAIFMDSSRLFSHKKQYIKEEINEIKNVKDKAKTTISKRKKYTNEVKRDIKKLHEDEEEEDDFL